MAKCPGTNCKVEWQWDWCMDHYRNKKTGDFCDCFEGLKFEVKNKDTTKKIELTVYICTECKTVISVQVLDSDSGCEIFNHPSWERLNWQAKAHSYPC